jgi:uncharacterized protein with PQ loop repeat
MVRHGAAHKHVHKKAKKGPFDYMVYFVMVATPLFEIPQAYTIYTTHDAQSVSLATWGFFFIASIVWGIYAIREKLLPIFVTSVLYLVIEATVVIGILLYR